MEITRQPLGAGSKEEFRSRQLTARAMLKGELEGEDLERYVEDSVITTTLDKASRWAVGNAMFPCTFGLACCAIEMMTMVAARQALAGVHAKVKHMILLTDGETEGNGYPELATQLRNEGVTVSSVAVGNDADRNLLRAIAASGGGKYYETYDPAGLTKIFTQDTMLHMGRLIREESFLPKRVERHPMVEGCPLEQAPTTRPRSSMSASVVSSRARRTCCSTSTSATPLSSTMLRIAAASS